MIEIFLILGLIFGLYMAWNVGANDFANSMSTAVGAKALTYRQIIILGAILEFAGAYFVGSHVSDTMRKKIVDPALLDPHTIAIGALAALIGACIWVTISTWKELPVSTTHSIVGGLWGFGLVVYMINGVDAVSWGTLGKVMLSWILSPVVGALIAYLVFRGIVRVIFDSDEPIKRTRMYGPALIGATFFIIALSLLLKTNLGDMVLGNKDDVTGAFMYAVMAFGLGAAAGYVVIRRKLGVMEHENYLDSIEGMFRKLQIITSCYIACAHGANDVANAVGPMAVVINYALEGTVGATVTIPGWILALGAMGIVVGIATWGYKVIKTVGFKITKLTNTRGFSVDFGAATTVLIASKLGMPISTTHTVVGAIIGVGLARGLEAVDLSVVKKIVLSWAFTVPVAALTAGGIYLLLATIL